MQRARENSTRAVIAAITGGVVICTIALQLRGFAFSADPSLCASIDTIGAFLTFTFTANALVRFRGTRDMMSLVLAVGFGVVGLMQLALALHLFHNLDSAVRLLDSNLTPDAISSIVRPRFHNCCAMSSRASPACRATACA